MQTVREVIFFIMCLGEYCAARWLLLPQMTDRTLSWQEKLRLWIPTLLVGVLYAYNGLLSFVSTSMLLFSSVSSGILFLIFCRKLSGKVLIWDAFSMTILFLIKCMVLIIEGFVWQMNMIDINHDIKRSWAEVAVEAGLIILLLSIGNTLRRKKILLLTFCGHYWKWMLFGSIAGEELMGYIMINSWSDMNFPMLVLNIVTIFAGIFLTLILFLLFVLAQIKQEREIMNYQQRSTQEYYEELRRQYEKLGKINHDIKNERACIYHLLEEGNTEKAKEILQAKQKKNSGLREIWDWRFYGGLYGQPETWRDGEKGYLLPI